MVKVILLIALLVGLVFLMVRSQRLERWWRQRRETSDTQPSQIGRLRERASQQLQATWQRLRPGRPQPPTPQAFAAWATTAIEMDRETAVWFRSLSPDHLAVLTRFVDEFCASMGFELNWLLQEQVANKPDLNNTLTQVVGYYLEACRLTFAVRDDLLEFNTPAASESTPRPSLAEVRHKMEQSVKTMLQRNGKTAEMNNEVVATSQS